MPARHTGVGQPELGVLPAPHDVGAVTELVGPAAAVIELQGDRASRCCVAALPVASVATGRRLTVVIRGSWLAVVVVAAGGFGVPTARGRIHAARRAFGVLRVVLRCVVLRCVVLLSVVRPAVSGAALLVTLVVPAALVGVSRTLFRGSRRTWGRIATLILASRPATIISIPAVARLPAAWLTAGRAVAARPVALVVALAAVATRRYRPLFIGRRVALPLVGVATLVLVATLVGVAALVLIATLVGVAALVLIAALVGVAALVLVPALIRVAALIGVATLVGVAALIGTAGRRVSGLRWVAAWLRRIAASGVLSTLGIRAARIVLRPAVAVVVVVIAGAPLPLTSAIARIVSHRWYSWFCGERLIRLWPDGIANRRAGLDVGVDSTAGAELPGMQVRRLLEPDDHITIRLPPLFMDIVSQVASESARREVRVGFHLLKVVHTEGNDVFVGRQKAISLQRPDAVGGFAAQQGFDFLRNDRSPEHPGKRIADGGLELALDALREPSLATRHLVLARTCSGISSAQGKRLVPHVVSPQHGIGTPRRRGTVGFLRIASRQLRDVWTVAPRMLEGRADPRRLVGARGYYSGMVHRLLFGRVAEWQTRWLQVPVSFGTWGFKSPFAHPERFYELQV